MDDGLMRFPTSISAACAREEEGCRSSFRRRRLKVSDSLTSTCPWVRTVSQKGAIDQRPANAITRISLARFSPGATRLPWREASPKQSRPSLLWDGHFFPCCNAPKASACTYVELYEK